MSGTNWGPITGPIYVAGGWFQMPQFPSRWYHPVLGSVLVNTPSDFLLLDGSWSPSPGLADMRRTESEAELVITHDITLDLLAMTGGTPTGTPASVNRRSSSWQEVINQGWSFTPFAAAQEITGPAPPVVPVQPSHAPAPGYQTPPFGITPVMGSVAAAVSAGVPHGQAAPPQPGQAPPPQAAGTAGAVSAGVPHGQAPAGATGPEQDQAQKTGKPKQGDDNEPHRPAGPGSARK